MNTPLFRLSLLSLTLAAGFAHAENEAKDNVVLDTVTVKGDRQGSKIKTNIVTLRQKDETRHRLRRRQRFISIPDAARHGSKLGGY